MTQPIQHLVSRIARTLKRHAPSRRATLALLVLTVGLNGVFDVVVTLDAWALEGNPAVLTLGPLWFVAVKWAVLTVLLGVAAHTWRADDPEWWLGYSAIGPLLVGLAAPANLLTLGGLASPTGRLGVGLLVGCGVLTTFLYARPGISVPSIRKGITVTMTVVVVSSIVIAGVGPVDRVSPVGTVQAVEQYDSGDLNSDTGGWSGGLASHEGYTGLDLNSGADYTDFDVYEEDFRLSGNLYVENASNLLEFTIGDITAEVNGRAGNNRLVINNGSDYKITKTSWVIKPGLYSFDLVSDGDSVSFTVGGHTVTNNADPAGNDSVTVNAGGATNELLTSYEIGSVGSFPTKISGQVTQGGMPIAGASVNATNWPSDAAVKNWSTDSLGSHRGFFQETSTTTDSNGNYTLQLPQRFNGSIKVSGFRYKWGYDYQMVSADQSQTADLVLGHGAPKGDGNGGYAVGCQATGPCNASDPNTISGVVVDQDGDLVSNATVMAYGSKKPDIPEARENLTSLADITPPEWDPSQQLTGGSGYFNTEGLGLYAPVHATDTVPAEKAWIGEFDLSSPLLRLPTNEEVIVSSWDAQKGNGIVDVDYNTQLPGRAQNEGPVIVEKIGAESEVVSTDHVPLDQLAEAGGSDLPAVGGVFEDQAFAYGKTTLTPGFYRIYPKGAVQKGPVYVAGDPTAMLERAKENVQGQLTERSQQIKAAVESSGLVKKEVTTGPNGTWTMPMQTNATQIYAVKQPAGLNVDARQLTMQKIGEQWTTAYRTPVGGRSQQAQKLLNASVYFPSRVQTVDRGAKNVTLQMTELSAPENANISAFDNRTRALADRIKNQSLSELPSAVQDKLENLSDERLRDHIEDKNDLIDKNQQLKDRLDELQEQRDLPDEVSVGDSKTADLRGQLQAMQQAIAEMQSTTDTGDPTVDRGSDTITYEQPFGTALDMEDVSVTAHYSNGSSRVVSNRYLTLDDSLTGGSTVRVAEYPAPENAASIRFEVTTATEEAVGKASETVSSPSYNGSVPSIDSVAWSSLKPGPGERVSATISGGDETTITGIDSATVYGPGGAELTPSIMGRTVSWTTNGTGTHVARVTITDVNGGSHVLPLRVQVGDTDTKQPPSVRMVETPFGSIAQTGDGITGGSVDVADDGSQTITAQVPVDADVPGEVHVYTEGTSAGADADTTVRVVRGQQRQSVNKHVTTVIHGQTLADSAIVYRRTDEDRTPLTREGNAWGQVTDRADGATIETVTAADGEVTVSINNNPSTIDRILFGVRQRTDGLPIVGAIFPVGPGSMPPPGGGPGNAFPTPTDVLVGAADLSASIAPTALPIAEV